MKQLSLARRTPLPWVACGASLALLAFLAAVLQPLPLLAAAAAAFLGPVLGAALVLAALWRRFQAAEPAAREASGDGLRIGRPTSR